MGVHFCDAAVRLEVIQAPYPNVAGHVLNAERARPKRESANRRTLRIPVVNFAIAPGKNSVAVGKIRQIAAMLMVAPRKLSPIRAARCELPLSFGRQPVFFPLPGRQPNAIFYRVQMADVND